MSDTSVDMVNHPPHYTRGPWILFQPDELTAALGYPLRRIIECIEVIRHIRDMRLANAMKYIWRVAFGGKDNDHQDIKKAIWYLEDYLEHPVQ